MPTKDGAQSPDLQIDRLRRSAGFQTGLLVVRNVFGRDVDEQQRPERGLQVSEIPLLDFVGILLSSRTG
jgi:hypothetical protein